MRSHLWLVPTFALACAVTMSSCGGGASPSSPSSLTPLTTPGANLRLRPLDEPPVLDPIAQMISIVGSFGSSAFAPNPIQAVVGDVIVWLNGDTRVHHIVLDDGTDVGDVAPGESSAPMMLMNPTATYHCTIHPSMVGTIGGDMSAIPPTPPYTPPPDDPYGYY